VRLLLDTHVFLWWCEDDPRLGEVERAAIRDGANEVFLSAASVWEMAIKQALGLRGQERHAWIGPDERVVRDQSQAFRPRLSHEQAIERVSVKRRKRDRCLRMRERNREGPDAHARRGHRRGLRHLRWPRRAHREYPCEAGGTSPA
jgi:PIN domain nuclease of toxin-antitoxin system